MKEMFDYKKLYLEKYKKLPHYYFMFTLLSLGIVSTIISILFFALAWNAPDLYTAIAIVVLLGGWIIALVLACWVRWIYSIKLSQSVVVADVLLKTANDSNSMENSSNEEDELPQL